MKSLAVFLVCSAAILTIATIAARSYSITIAKEQGEAQGKAQAEAFTKSLEKTFQRPDQPEPEFIREHNRKSWQEMNARRTAAGLDPIPDPTATSP